MNKFNLRHNFSGERGDIGPLGPSGNVGPPGNSSDIQSAFFDTILAY